MPAQVLTRHASASVATGHSSFERLAVPAATAVVAFGGLVASAGAEDGLVLCPYRRCTGGYCPGCGATRAAHRLLTGDLAGSWRHHPWVLLAVAQAALVAVVLTIAARAKRRPVRTLLARGWLPVVIANVALLLGIWGLRLAAGTVPTGW